MLAFGRTLIYVVEVEVEVSMRTGELDVVQSFSTDDYTHNRDISCGLN